MQFLHALRVRLTSHPSRLTRVGRARSSAVRSESSSIGAAPDEAAAEKDQSGVLDGPALGRAEGALAKGEGEGEAESSAAAGRFLSPNESGTEETAGLLPVIYREERSVSALGMRGCVGGGRPGKRGTYTLVARLNSGQSSEDQFAPDRIRARPADLEPPSRCKRGHEDREE